MHHLVNFVTEEKGYPGAVLVRAIQPEWGVGIMSRRRRRTRLRDLASGPSKLCQAMDIDLRLNGVSLRGPELVVRYDGLEEQLVETGPRVGISAGTRRPWRFWVSENPYVSPGKPGPPRRGLRRDGG
jgi:DNA-3-methyladenine glycosylase